ncbi:MAG: hypothetical protein LBT00_03790 [Spirochaetaceae bacterium]|jgi:hypothetical protein|nr:hypothetical protein [Spirochaetaceae bacterium]
MGVPLRAGAGKSIISINAEMLPLDRFIAVHDDLYVRMVIIECGMTICLVSVEMTSLTDECVSSLKNYIAKKTKIKEEHIWICVSHTFSAPHILSQDQRNNLSQDDRKKTGLLMDALSSAVENALEDAMHVCEAVFRRGQNTCDINRNRDIYSDDGWWIGINPDGISDKTLYTLGFYDKNDNPLAVIYNYGIQPSILDGVFDAEGQRMISADVSGETSRRVERALGGNAVALFLPAASGDQAPKEKAVYKKADKNDKLILKKNAEDGFALIAKLGGEFASAVLYCMNTMSVNENIAELQKNAIPVICPRQQKPFDGLPEPSKRFVSIPDGEIETRVEFLQLGNDMVIIGVKPELNCVTALEIKKESPFKHTLITQMVNGGQKYMADRESYQRGCYEAMDSFFAEGSAEIVVKRVCGTLHEIVHKRFC